MLKRKELSARELVEYHIQRNEQINGKINALAVPLFEQALETAVKRDEACARREELGPLHGLPITVKESIDVAGLPSTLGLTARVSHRAAADAPQVAMLKQSGAVLLGKTNVSLLLKAYETDNPVYGRTNNPWNLDRAPGGSSGGEGSLIAAHGSVLGLGSDLGGSIRLPAHACGIHGLRPTSGRFTMLGHSRVYPSGLGGLTSQPGPMARHVADLGLVMQALTCRGHEATDPSVPPVPWKREAEISNLKIGFYTDNGILTPSPAIRRAVREAANALSGYGAEVEEWTPPNLTEAWELQLRIGCADGLASYRRALRNSKGTKARIVAMPASVRYVASLLAQVSGQKRLASTIRYKHRASLQGYSELLLRRREYSLRFLAALNSGRYDAIICPADALPALKHGSSHYVSGCAVSYGGLYTLIGMPAGVVAATRVRTDEETDRPRRQDWVERAANSVERGSVGLPVGVQVVARHWREDVVLAVMSSLEQHFRNQADYPARPPL